MNEDASEKYPFSVLMSVYYRESPRRLAGCLQSLANQSFMPSQVVLVEDGPISPELSKCIESAKVTLNITSVKLLNNSGLAVALNEGLKHCDNEIVARMDTDDVAEIDRFERQIPVMAREGYDLVGGQIVEVDEEGNFVGVRNVPLVLADIVSTCSTRSPFNHMTVAFKKSFVDRVGGYPDLFLKEDYALWVKMLSAGARCCNLDRVLVKATAGSSLYERRGGRRYVVSEYELFRLMVSSRMSSPLKASVIFLLRSLVFLTPPKVRAFVYTHLLRSRD